MTVPVNRMENLAASGSVSGSLKVSSAGSPSSSSSSPRRRQASLHLSLPGKASGSSSCSRVPGAAVSVAGAVGLCRIRGTVQLRRLVRQAVVRPSPFTVERIEPHREGKEQVSSAALKYIADLLLNCLYCWIGIWRKTRPSF